MEESKLLIDKNKKIRNNNMENVAYYKKFINESDDLGNDLKKFVKGQKRLLKLFISPTLEKILSKMMKTADFQAKAVANRILNIDKEDENLFDISYLDIDREKDDSVTFISAQRAWVKSNFQNQEEADQKPSPGSELWTTSGRQSLSIGKLVNKLFDNFSEIAVDKFVNAYKAEIAAITIYDRFKLVRGEDIKFWYAEKNYFTAGGSGTLLGSCMRYDGTSGGKSCQQYFDIYTKNPEKCALLILTNRDNKLLGRALVWSNLRKPTDKTFMDRIYTVKQSDVELFKKYAQEQGWLYKNEQRADDVSYIEDGQRVNKSMAVQLNPGTYKYYPYMDSLKYYNPTTGRLGSDPGNKPEGTKRFKLDGTGGNANQID